MRTTTVGLLALFLTLATPGPPPEASPRAFELHCRKASGFYGWLDIVAAGEEVRIDARQGYAWELARKLKLNEKVGRSLKATVPLAGCRFSEADGALIECHAKQVQLGFGGDEPTELTASDVGFWVSRIHETTVGGTRESLQTVVSVTLPDRAGTSAVVSYDKPATQCGTK
jgi:hypothetical protein